MNTKYCKNCKQDYDVTLSDGITCPECETPFKPMEQTNYVHVSRTCCPKCGTDSMNGVEHECKAVNSASNNHPIITDTSQMNEKREVPSEDWEQKFDKEFHFSSGDPNFSDTRDALKDFIRQTRQEAVEEYKAKLLQKLPRKFWEDEDHAVGGYISKKDLKELLSQQGE